MWSFVNLILQKLWSHYEKLWELLTLSVTNPQINEEKMLLLPTHWDSLIQCPFSRILPTSPSGHNRFVSVQSLVWLPPSLFSPLLVFMSHLSFVSNMLGSVKALKIGNVNVAYMKRQLLSILRPLPNQGKRGASIGFLNESGSWSYDVRESEAGSPPGLLIRLESGSQRFGDRSHRVTWLFREEDKHFSRCLWDELHFILVHERILQEKLAT